MHSRPVGRWEGGKSPGYFSPLLLWLFHYFLCRSSPSVLQSPWAALAEQLQLLVTPSLLPFPSPGLEGAVAASSHANPWLSFCSLFDLQAHSSPVYSHPSIKLPHFKDLEWLLFFWSRLGQTYYPCQAPQDIWLFPA